VIHNAIAHPEPQKIKAIPVSKIPATDEIALEANGKRIFDS
jgi:hypothetical protein